MSDRTLPSNPEAERTVLGAVLLDNAAFDSAAQLIRREDFYSPAHGRIFEAMADLVRRGAPVDPVTLKAELVAGSALDRIGGQAYIAGLIDGVPRLSNVEQWCRIVRGHAVRRSLIRMASHLADASYDTDREPDDVIAKALDRLTALSRRVSPGEWLDNTQLYKAALHEIDLQSNEPDGILGLRTGLVDLDRKLQGIRRGQLGIIAGRLKSGKSVLAVQVAESVVSAAEIGESWAGEGHVRVFSLEMSGIQLTKRRMSSAARVSLNRLHTQHPEQRTEAWAALARTAPRIQDGRLRISTQARRVDEMAAMLRREQARHPLALVVVDYLQLVEAQQRHRARHEAVAEVSASLKRMAVDLDVPVIAVAQLNRAPEARKDKTPCMADLADSDALGRDCDWAVLIHRDPPPLKGQDPRSTRNLADLILDANRDGWTGVVRVRFNRIAVQFENLARDEAAA